MFCASTIGVPRNSKEFKLLGIPGKSSDFIGIQRSSDHRVAMLFFLLCGLVLLFRSFVLLCDVLLTSNWELGFDTCNPPCKA